MSSLADYDRGAGRAGRRGDRATTGSSRGRVDASDQAAIEALLAGTGSTRCSARPTRGSRCRSSEPRSPRGVHYLDMAMSLSRPHPDRAVPADRREARRRAVRARRRSGRDCRPARRSSASASSPGCPTCSPATPPTTCSARSTRPACATARTWTVAGARLRAVVLDLDHHRGVPEPAGDLREGPRLVHHRAVQRTGGLRLPGGHRPGRVRQRRARRGAADPALGRRQAGDVQVRAGRRVHRRAARRCTSSAWTAPRRCRSPVETAVAGRCVARATSSPPACPTRPPWATG